jgi:hypothetical protein
MLYLVLAVLCYLATSVTMKVASLRGLDAIAVNLALRVSGTVLTVVLLVVTGASLHQPQLPTASVIALASGICTFFSGYMGLRALDLGSLNATWTIMRISTVIPVLASILVWGELRTAAAPHEVLVKLLGVACLMGALVLLGRGRHE